VSVTHNAGSFTSLIEALRDVYYSRTLQYGIAADIIMGKPNVGKCMV